MSQVVWVDSKEQLDQCVSWAQQQPLLAFDTEFIRVSTFYAKPALIQLSDGSSHWLIDPTVVGVDWLKPLFDSNIVFVGHALSEDLELFTAQLGMLPNHFVDTQVGHSLATGDHMMGYANLVELRLQQQVDKSASRSDWLKRPLTQAQLTYAVQDVSYLPTLYKLIYTELVAKERVGWWAAEASRQTEAAAATQRPEAWLERMAARPDLKGAHWPTVVALTKWREDEVRAKDLSRNRLLKDEFVVMLARLRPTESWQFDKLQGVPASIINKYGEQWLAIVESCRDTQGRPPKTLSLQRGKAAKKVVREVAEQLHIVNELVASGRDLQRLFSAYATSSPLPNMFEQGWRATLVTPKLKTVLKEESK